MKKSIHQKTANNNRQADAVRGQMVVEYLMSFSERVYFLEGVIRKGSSRRIGYGGYILHRWSGC